jgi:hypothetical protein
MTTNQREDMDRHLELEEKWHPLNRYQRDSFDVFCSRASWVTGILAVLCALACIGHEIFLRLPR